MKQIVILGDTFNKVSDTSSTFRFNLVKDGVIQDVGHQQLSVTIANSSGYLFDITPVNSGTEVWVDFNDEKLKTLTPDDYQLEIRVTNTDGDVEIYPSNGSIPFTVTKNLRSSTAQTVPYVTFDEVLKQVDDKVNEYVHTIQKGDKGDTGPKGDPGELHGFVGGRNLLSYTNQNNHVLLNNGNGTVKGTFVPFTRGYKYNIEITMASTNWLIFQQTGISRERLKTDTDYTFSFMINSSFDIKPGFTLANGSAQNGLVSGITSYDSVITAGTDKRVVFKVHTIKTFPNVLDQSTYINGFANHTGTVQIWDLKLEEGTIPTDWTPAPEDTDNALLHNTGNETATGNKTFNGQTTLLLGNSGFRITTTGFEKSTDGGKTWVTANI